MDVLTIESNLFLYEYAEYIAINGIALNKVRFAKANFYNQLLKTEEIKYIPIELNFFFYQIDI